VHFEPPGKLLMLSALDNNELRLTVLTHPSNISGSSNQRRTVKQSTVVIQHSGQLQQCHGVNAQASHTQRS
jgi:hypothetical protein